MKKPSPDQVQLVQITLEPKAEEMAKKMELLLPSGTPVPAGQVVASGLLNMAFLGVGLYLGRKFWW